MLVCVPGSVSDYRVKVPNGGAGSRPTVSQDKGVRCEAESEGVGGKLSALGTHPSVPFEAPI
jgi:hypothetical protein